MRKLRIKKDDEVMVIAGNHKGMTGRVLAVYPKKDKVLVEGVNIVVKHMKPNNQYPNGGIISKEMPIHISNVMLLDSDRNPTRVYFQREEVNGKMMSVRYAKSNDKKI